MTNPITAILWPTFVLVALVYVVWFVMYVRRIGLMKRQPPNADDFATSESSLRYFQPVDMPANNLRNLFEMPVLYFALVPLLLIVHMANHIQVTLAWAYVVLRIVHSLIHAASGPMMARFAAYALSCAVLAAMWIGFAVDIAAAT